MSEKPDAVKVFGSPSARKPRLFRLRHGHRVLLLGSGTVTLGRRATCDYVLHDSQVSREHARIIVGEQTFAIEDLGSANGVLVNGEPIRGLRRLNSGDNFRIGSQVFEIIEATEVEVDDEDRAEMTVVSRKVQVRTDVRTGDQPRDEDWEDRPTRVVDRERR
jgi:pSer/pThr/pTyr-binding forkhead associated (FHA) protein